MAGNRAAVTSRTMSLCSLKKKESPRIISAEAPRSLNWSSAGPIASRLSASAISTPTPSAAAAFLIDANCSSLHASLGLLKEAFPDMVSNLARPDGNITGFASLSLELHIYIARRPPELVDEIGPIGDQAAGGGEAAFKIDCGQFVTGRQRNDQIAMKRSRPAPRYDQTPVRRAHEGRKGALSLMWGAHVDWVYLHAERRGQGLDGAELADSGGVRDSNLRDRAGHLCCSGRDCRPVQVTVLPDGNYYLPESDETIPAEMATPSPDDRFHRCAPNRVPSEFDPWGGISFAS